MTCDRRYFRFSWFFRLKCLCWVYQGKTDQT